MSLILVCSEENDLCRVLRASGTEFRRSDDAARAVSSAAAGDGVLVLAEQYPQERTDVEPGVYDAAKRAGVRLYVEYPRAVPGVELGETRTAEWERIVLASDAFAPRLEPLRILSMHRCRTIACETDRPHLVSARVAGFDRAVYGIPDSALPVLFSADPTTLVATTKLSAFVTARYAPAAAWTEIWRWVLSWACQELETAELRFTPAVGPAYGAEERLPADAELHALRRGATWFSRARLLVHPGWSDEARRRLESFHDGTGPGPEADWPAGDGSCGMIEGASSRIHPDGSQDWRYHLRGDCMSESAMAVAALASVADDRSTAEVAGNLLDFVLLDSVLGNGPRADPQSPSYGLLAWTTLPPADGVYYGDDNARVMLAAMAAAGLLGAKRWDERVSRCLLANLRTTGPSGFRGRRLEEADLQKRGWRHYHELDRLHFAPHYESWLWACYLLAYRQSGSEAFRDCALSGIRLTMEAYPHEWRWTNGMQQERARMLLPLAWLVRADGSARHRDWLRRVGRDLLARQDACGAIAEEVGAEGHGSYGPPRSNEAYGTAEAPLIQQNGDPLCDLLYTSNFAFIGLYEAAAATGEQFYADAADRLAGFLCRCQVRSAAHPELDGGWFRAFDFRLWDYWASNADEGWGAWCIESGWTQGWISTTFALRCMGASLWDVAGGAAPGARVGPHLQRLLPLMLQPSSEQPPGLPS